MSEFDSLKALLASSTVRLAEVEAAGFYGCDRCGWVAELESTLTPELFALYMRHADESAGLARCPGTVHLVGVPVAEHDALAQRLAEVEKERDDNEATVDKLLRQRDKVREELAHERAVIAEIEKYGDEYFTELESSDYNWKGLWDLARRRLADRKKGDR